eukprot:gnl/TRDRNA2_/TRDRNA2_127911_c1_seq1.p1 gnl/TRDRNA2_/TRDRNA2_127911_c1~~gnl/TRDRNA2_/TRDRNA2_127911_c1_seq1.p1  ORF type:complete len:423 (+),score=103.07 gnl/TRDRNA2_/TRDRNA2_127911_c1_seq1:84-1352(+)
MDIGAEYRKFRLPTGPNDDGDGDTHALARSLRHCSRDGAVEMVDGIIQAIEDVGGERPHTQQVNNAMKKLLSQPDASGYTALHYATMGNSENHTAIVRMLLKSNANANAQDDNGWSPLHVAAQSGSLEMINALVLGLSDRQLQDAHGRIPRDVANGEERRKLLENPKDKLEDVIARAKKLIRQKIVFKHYTMEEIQSMERLCLEFRETIKGCLFDARLQQKQIEVMFEEPIDEATDMKENLAKANKALEVNRGLCGELDDLKQAKALIPLLRKVIADASLMGSLAEISETILMLQKQDASPKKRAQEYRKLLENLDHAIVRGMVGDIMEEADEGEMGILQYLDIADGHYASDNILDVARKMFDLLEDICTTDPTAKHIVPIEDSIRQLTAMAVSMRPKPVELPEEKGGGCTMRQCKGGCFPQ